MNVSKAKSIAAYDVKTMLGTSGEYALVDVREEGDFSKAHQLLSINMPLSRLELLCGKLIPCKKTTVVIVDDGLDKEEHLAERGAACLLELGYSDVRIMEGGMHAWAAAGYKVFAGVFVPSDDGIFEDICSSTKKIMTRNLQVFSRREVNVTVYS